MRPFRFGVGTYFITTHPSQWIKTFKHIEKLGYSSFLQPDHFRTRNHDPLVMLSTAAAVTTKLNLGTIVFAIDYRHPVIYAKTAAALHLLSGGRFEFGIGAGWSKNDYKMSGIQYDTHATRIRRLDEALTIIKSMWTQDTTTYNGKYYQLDEMAKAGELSEGDYPKIMVGGGKKMILGVAGKHADIVGIQWAVPKGRFDGDSILETTLETVKQRIRWVKESARRHGRDPDLIEFQMIFPDCMITDDPESILMGKAKAWDIPLEAVVECPQWLIGSSGEIIDKLVMIREETGINYMVFCPTDMETIDIFAHEIVSKLNR